LIEQFEEVKSKNLQEIKEKEVKAKQDEAKIK